MPLDLCPRLGEDHFDDHILPHVSTRGFGQFGHKLGFWLFNREFGTTPRIGNGARILCSVTQGHFIELQHLLLPVDDQFDSLA